MDLKTYLAKEEISLAKFARKCDISWNTARNIANGQDVRISLGMRIETFTNGKVTLYDLHKTLEGKNKKPKTNT